MAKYGKQPSPPKPGWLDGYAKTCKPCDGTGRTCKSCNRSESKCRCRTESLATCPACGGSGVANLEELERLVREREAVNR